MPQPDPEPGANEPVPPESASETHASRAPGFGQKRAPFARVLLVDNDAAVAQVITSILSTERFDVTVAQDAETALRLLEGHQLLPSSGDSRPSAPYDLMILDLRMPGMGGIGLIRRIGETEESWARALPPIVIVSGFVSEEDRRLLDESHSVHAIVEKPFDLFQLLACAKDAVLSRRGSILENTRAKGAAGDAGGGLYSEGSEGGGGH